jgi:uncharacterized protein YbcI
MARGFKNGKTKRTVEAEIEQALTEFEIEYKGRGPKSTRAFIIDNMILVRLQGVLTPAEQMLAKNEEGSDLIKTVRSILLEQARDVLAGVIRKITQAEVVSLHTDISTRTGERVILFTLNESLEKRFYNLLT